MDNEKNRQLGEWISAIAAGDCSAIGKIYESIGKVMYSVAKLYLKDPTDAEDVVHDALLKIVAKAKMYRRNKNAYAWVNTIVKNTAKDALRGMKSKETVSYDTAFLEEGGIPEDTDVRLLRAFGALTRKERDLVVYKFWYGLSLSEIADLQHVPKSTLEYRMETACEKLKNYFEP